MWKLFLKKGLVIGIILLFISAAIPNINANIKNTAEITFLIEGFGIESIKFDGKEYHNYEMIEVNIGQYNIRTGVYVIGGSFDGWTTSGDITIQDYDSSNTIVYVNGNGIITLHCHWVSPPVTCFPAGTKITMADGNYKNIEDIKIGDKVIGYDLEKNQFTSWTVRILERPFNPVCNINNGLLRITPEHPIYISKSNGIIGCGAVEPLNNAMIIASEITKIDVGDKIFTSNETWLTINDISFESNPIQLYNFVSYTGTKTYFANDILVYEDFTKPIWNIKYIFKNSETPIRSLIDFLKTLQFLP